MFARCFVLAFALVTLGANSGWAQADQPESIFSPDDFSGLESALKKSLGELEWTAPPVPEAPAIIPARVTTTVPMREMSFISGTIDVYAFEQALNAYRARYGRAPVRYNPRYDSIARENNRLQRIYNRCGHHYHQGIAQNAAGGYRGVAGLMHGWSTSAGHNRLLLDTSSTEFGIHHDGHWATLVMPSRYLGFPYRGR